MTRSALFRLRKEAFVPSHHSNGSGTTRNWTNTQQ